LLNAIRRLLRATSGFRWRPIRSRLARRRAVARLNDLSVPIDVSHCLTRRLIRWRFHDTVGEEPQGHRRGSGAGGRLCGEADRTPSRRAAVAHVHGGGVTDCDDVSETSNVTAALTRHGYSTLPLTRVESSVFRSAEWKSPSQAGRWRRVFEREGFPGRPATPNRSRYRR
jgi:hypothetical protein